MLASISDAACDVTGFASQPHISSLVYSLMCQATTPFTVLISMLFLQARYWWIEILAVTIMIGGAGMCILLKRKADDDDNSTFWSIFTAATTIFAAISYVLKEKTFKDYETSNKNASSSSSNLEDPLLNEDHKINSSSSSSPPSLLEENKKLSVFLVGWIVAATSLFVCVPVALLNQAILTSNPVWPAFTDAMKCFSECDHGMSTYIVYAAINILYNLCILTLTGHVSALLAFLSLKMSVPLVAIFSPIPFPLIGAQTVTFGQWSSLFVMSFGLILFRYYNTKRRSAM